MKCSACGHEFKSPVAVAGGEAGGKAKVAKGFASARVLAKALRTRARNARAKHSHNVPLTRGGFEPSRPTAGSAIS